MNIPGVRYSCPFCPWTLVALPLGVVGGTQADVEQLTRTMAATTEAALTAHIRLHVAEMVDEAATYGGEGG